VEVKNTKKLWNSLVTGLTVFAGLGASVILQSAFSSLAFSGQPMIEFKVEPDEEAKIRADIQKCGSDLACHVTNMNRYAKDGKKDYAGALRQMHPNVRFALGQNCKSIGDEIIHRTLCYRDKLGMMADDVQKIQEARDRESGAALLTELKGLDNFTVKIFIEKCTATPTDSCFDDNARALRAELTDASNAMAEAFDNMARWSVFRHDCDDKVGAAICDGARTWRPTDFVVKPSDVAYAPRVRLPGDRAAAAAAAAAKAAAEGNGSSNTGSGNGGGGSSASSGTPGGNGGTGAGKPSTTTGHPGGKPGTRAQTGVPGAQPSGTPSGVPSGVPGGKPGGQGTNPGGAAGPNPGPSGAPSMNRDQMLGMIPLGSPTGKNTELDCSDAARNRALKLMITPASEENWQAKRIAGEAVHYACIVRTDHATNKAAMFLADAALRAASLIRQPDLDDDSLQQFLGALEADAKILAADPTVADSQDLGALVTDMDAVATDSKGLLNSAASSILGSGSGTLHAVQQHQASLESHLCAWKRAVEAAEHESAAGFPHDIVACRGGQ
jgi:hypothetical protein